MTRAHPKLCQCEKCVAQRFSAFQDRIKTFRTENRVGPTNADQTVPVRSFTVRAHFRRNPRHLNQDEGLKERVHAYFQQLAKRTTKGEA